MPSSVVRCFGLRLPETCHESWLHRRFRTIDKEDEILDCSTFERLEATKAVFARMSESLVWTLKLLALRSRKRL